MSHFRFHSHSFAAFPLRKEKERNEKKRKEKKRKELWNIVTTIVARKLLDVALFPGSFVHECNIGEKKGEPWDISTCDKPHK